MTAQVLARIYWQALRLGSSVRRSTPTRHVHPEKPRRGRPSSNLFTGRPAGEPAAAAWRGARCSPVSRRVTAGRLRVRDGRRTAPSAPRSPHCRRRSPCTTRAPMAPRLRRLGRRRRGLHAGLLEPDDLTALVRVLLRNRAVAGRLRGRLARAVRAAARIRHFAESQHSRREPPQHRGTLRSRQRLLRAVARRVADVLVRDLRPRRADARGSVSARSSTGSAASLRLRPGTTCSRSAPAGAASRIHAARDYGCRVTTTTISRAARARERARARGRASPTA